MNKSRKGYVSYPTSTVWPSLQRAPSTIFEGAEEDVLPHSVNVLLLTCCVVRVIDVEYTLLKVRQLDLPISIYKVCMRAYVCVCLCLPIMAGLLPNFREAAACDRPEYASPGNRYPRNSVEAFNINLFTARSIEKNDH